MRVGWKAGRLLTVCRPAGLGVFVSRTEPEGLARSAGLRVGDELIIVNGYDVRRFPLQQVQQVGKPVTASFALSITVTLGLNVKCDMELCCRSRAHVNILI